MAVEIQTSNQSSTKEKPEWIEFGIALIHGFLILLALAWCLCALGWSLGAVWTFIQSHGFTTIFYINPGWTFLMAVQSIFLSCWGLSKINFGKYFRFLIEMIPEKDGKLLLETKLMRILFYGVVVVFSIFAILSTIKSYLFWYA